MNVSQLIKATRWATLPITKNNLTNTSNVSILRDAARQEKKWITKHFDIKHSCWSGKLGEDLVEHMLFVKKGSVWKPERTNGIQPDWETRDAVWEVKTRNWSVPGTAGEKILGVPYKYSDVPELYGKPLKIVCVGYQEWECTNRTKMKIFGNDVSHSKQQQLKLWKLQGIEFVPFSIEAGGVWGPAARKFFRECIALADDDRDIDLYHWSSTRFSRAWFDSLSVLVARGRAKVSAAAAASDWPKRIRDMQYMDVDDSD